MSDAEIPVGPAARRVQALGLSTAADVVERILAISREIQELRMPDLAAGTGDGGTREDPAAQLRRLRADSDRLLELYGEWTRSMIDGALGVLEDASQSSSADSLTVGPVRVGEQATTTIWMHLLDGPAAGTARLFTTVLTASDAAELPGGVCTFAPAELATDGIRTSTEVTVTTAVPADACPGTYRGHVLADGLPEVGLPLVVEVVA